MIDIGEARRGAIDNHVPEPVLALLVVVSCGALGFIGFGSGLANRRRLPSTITYIVLSTLVLLIIMDLDRPQAGADPGQPGQHAAAPGVPEGRRALKPAVAAAAPWRTRRWPGVSSADNTEEQQ